MAEGERREIAVCDYVWGGEEEEVRVCVCVCGCVCVYKAICSIYSHQKCKIIKGSYARVP